MMITRRHKILSNAMKEGNVLEAMEKVDKKLDSQMIVVIYPYVRFWGWRMGQSAFQEFGVVPYPVPLRKYGNMEEEELILSYLALVLVVDL